MQQVQCIDKVCQTYSARITLSS